MVSCGGQAKVDVMDASSEVIAGADQSRFACWSGMTTSMAELSNLEREV